MTLAYSLKRIATMIAVALIGISTFIGCSDDEAGGQPAPVANSYRWLNNQCVDQHNTPVNQSYCGNTNNNGGICYNQYGQQIQCSNSGGICYNQYGQQIQCSNGGSNNGSCASGEVYVPGFTPSCLPAGNCGINGRPSVIWNGYCYSL